MVSNNRVTSGTPGRVAAPTFSIVIPTRERDETLRRTLATCVEQTYEPLEIIVSDNAGGGRTREVAESFGDSRIRYVTTGRRVSMSRNWEFGLSHVTGDYVTFLGDDDGLMPNAVSDVAALITRFGAEAVSWLKADYHWPDHPTPEEAGMLTVPLANRLFVCDARRFARDCARLWTPYYKGPSLYNAFVSMAVLRRLREQSGGTFFHSSIPDAYSSIAIAAAIDCYYFSSRPFSINGASGRSNGANTENFLQLSEANSTAFFIDERDLPLHPKLPALIVGSVIGLVYEAVLQANDHIYGGTLPIDFDRVLTKIVREVAPASPQRYNTVVQQLQEISRDDARQQEVVRSALRRYPNRPIPPPPRRIGVGTGEVCTIDGTRAGITDVQAAARYVSSLLGPYRAPKKVVSYSRLSKVVTKAVTALRARSDPYVW